MKSRKNLIYIIFAVTVSAILMTFCSMTSFLFPIHTGVDQNCFFTVGKSMLDGRVLYRDIFEQKGPLLYFIHMLGALISKDSFFGVYLIQIINMSVIFIFMGKISDLFLNLKYKYLVSGISSVIIVTSHCFSKGDNAEEFCMTFILISLYFLCVYLKDTTRIPSMKAIFINGLLAGAILLIKFTILGFHIAWVIIIGIILIKRADIKKALLMCIVFLSGMLAATVPFLIYFIANNSLSDFIYVYFYSNIFLYSKNISLISRIGFFFGSDVGLNLILTPLTILGIAWICIGKKLFKDRFARLSILFSYVSLFFFIYVGGTRYRYYLLATSVFVIFGVIALCSLLKRLVKFFYIKKAFFYPLTAVILLFFIITASNISGYYRKPDSFYPQLQFAKIIKQTPNATILNYNFLDGGFFLASGSPLPDTKYFCKVNIPRENLPQMYDDQEKSIEEKKTDFVILRSWTSDDVYTDKPTDYLFENYELVTTADDDNEGYRYYLFSRK